MAHNGSVTGCGENALYLDAATREKMNDTRRKCYKSRRTALFFNVAVGAVYFLHMKGGGGGL